MIAGELANINDMRDAIDSSFWLIIGLLLFAGLCIALGEPLVPNAEDCRANGKADDCWRIK